MGRHHLGRATDLDRISARRDQLDGDIDGKFLADPLDHPAPACASSASEPEPGPSLRLAPPPLRKWRPLASYLEIPPTDWHTGS